MWIFVVVILNKSGSQKLVSLLTWSILYEGERTSDSLGFSLRRGDLNFSTRIRTRKAVVAARVSFSQIAGHGSSDCNFTQCRQPKGKRAVTKVSGITVSTSPTGRHRYNLGSLGTPCLRSPGLPALHCRCQCHCRCPKRQVHHCDTTWLKPRTKQDRQLARSLIALHPCLRCCPEWQVYACGPALSDKYTAVTLPSATSPRRWRCPQLQVYGCDVALSYKYTAVKLPSAISTRMWSCPQLWAGLA